MSAISNFTAYAKRRYFDGSSWKIEDIEFMQIAPRDLHSDRNILYKKESKVPISCDGLTRPLYDYYPGLVYKPKKYYKITDLFFTQSQLENVKTFFKNAWVLNPTSQVFGYLNADETSIIAFEHNGYYMYPIVKYSAGKSSGIPGKRIISAFVEVIISKFSPGNLKYSYEGKEIVVVNDNGTWRNVKSGDMYTNGQYMFHCYTGQPNTYEEWCEHVDNIFNNILKVKYYIIALTNTNIVSDVTLDGITYGKSATYKYKTQFYASLTSDYSNTGVCSNFCFSDTFQWLWYMGRTDLQLLTDLKIDTTKSPNPTQNPEDDDPNDDDPGWQDPDDDDDDEGGDGDHDDTSDPVPEPPLPDIGGSSNGLITVWNPTPSQLESLANQLWSPTVWQAISQYFTNPMESILSLAILPVAPKTISGTIHLGGYDTEISAGRVSNDYIRFNCGSIPINRYYGSYLDYAPFTKITCTLPYIGEIDIDPDQVMQKALSVTYHINCVTGECIAYLLADSNVFATYAGNCIKQLPICQTDFSSIISGAVQICSNVISAGATGGMGGAAEKSLFGATTEATKASESLVKANSSLLGAVMGMKANYRHSSQLGTGAGQLAPQAPFLTIIRPNLDLADNYKSYTGYPCNKNLDLSSLHGFTQIEASNLSVQSASLEEISEIKELLLKGVIL